MYKQNFVPDWKSLDIRAEMDFEFIRPNFLVQIDKLRSRERKWLEYILALLCVLGHITYLSFVTSEMWDNNNAYFFVVVVFGESKSKKSLHMKC